MAKQILASVGRFAVNRPMDVKTVQELLNRAGGNPPLVADGLCGPKTNAAIASFQQRYFGTADGRVDPGRRTMDKLNQFDTPGAMPPPRGQPPQVQPPQAQPPVSPPPGLSALRKRIIEVAKQQATPPPGKVSDLVTATDPATGKNVRAGWKQLQEFFDVAVTGWNANYWKDHQILAGVQVPGKRIPQPGTSGISWCGIFATWVLIKAGMNVKWTLGKGINLPLKSGQGFRPGDVCVKKGDRVHHFIPITDTDPMQTVNGNSDNQSILIKPTHKSQVAYYYQVD